jgi:hypothetical protein
VYDLIVRDQDYNAALDILLDKLLGKSELLKL